MMPADTFLVPAGHSPWTAVLLILSLSILLWAPIYYVCFRVPSLCKRRRGRLTLVALVALVPALSVASVLKLGEVVPPPADLRQAVTEHYGYDYSEESFACLMTHSEDFRYCRYSLYRRGDPPSAPQVSVSVSYTRVKGGYQVTTSQMRMSKQPASERRGS
jgi:hypothetical protein